MDTAVKELLLVWSIRLALACYLGRVAIDLRNFRLRQSQSRCATARLLWTGGLVLCVAHLGFAFAFVHDWSHDKAWAHTAAQTARVVGLEWGGGLYFNYAFTSLWFVDTVAWWTRGLLQHQRSRWWSVMLHSTFGFMFFNATVVFGPPWYKPVTIVVGMMLVASAVWPVSKKKISE